MCILNGCVSGRKVSERSVAYDVFSQVQSSYVLRTPMKSLSRVRSFWSDVGPCDPCRPLTTTFMVKSGIWRLVAESLSSPVGRFTETYRGTQ